MKNSKMIFVLVILFFVCSIITAIATKYIYDSISDDYYKQIETYKVHYQYK